jgi:DNA-directed RNA polymerase specialized sigma subunit
MDKETKIKIDEILKQYPYIADDIRTLQNKLNQYIALQADARNTLKGQALDGMPHSTGINDSTYKAVERLATKDYQGIIDNTIKQINALIDRKKRLDEAIKTLTEDEKRIVHLRYFDRWQTWKVMRRLGIEKDTYYQHLDSIRTKIYKYIA